MNRDLYKLVESSKGCEECELADLCDEVADNLNMIEYMLCAEEEDFEQFENPVYKLTKLN